MISDLEIVRCPRCGKTSSLRDWDDKSYKACLSREMRRAFVHLKNEKAFKRSTDTFYLCPKCNNWSRGSQLTIESEDIKLKKLGREPLFNIVKTC